jgi:hypothetical protein
MLEIGVISAVEAEDSLQRAMLCHYDRDRILLRYLSFAVGSFLHWLFHFIQFFCCVAFKMIRPQDHIHMMILIIYPMPEISDFQRTNSEFVKSEQKYPGNVYPRACKITNAIYFVKN